MPVSPPTLSPEHKKLLEGPLAVQVAAGDARLRPHVSRAWGVELSDDGLLSLSLLDAQTVQLQKALHRNPKVAVNVTNPVSLESLQFKGEVVEIREPDSTAREVVDRRLEQFKDGLAGTGIDRGRMLALGHRGAARQLVVRVNAVFVQTPGPGAGKALGAS